MPIERKAFLLGTGAVSVAALAPTQARCATPNVVLDVQDTTWEIKPGLVQRTTTAGGTYPGTPIRATLGSTIDVAVRNRTKAPVAIHWHGLIVSPNVDGVPELGTPAVEPGRTRLYRLPISVGGTRWYHTHNGTELLFGGLAGSFIVDRNGESGNYDREIILMLHEFDATIPTTGSMNDTRGPGAPTLSAPLANSAERSANTPGMNMDQPTKKDAPMSPNLLMRDARYASYAINGKALGFADPVRVKRHERVRFRVINASATLTHRLALPGHRFHVIELDGNPVPRPQSLSAIELGPGERVDAIVSMDEPGIWVLGSTEENARRNGLGIVVAYDGERGDALWRDPQLDAFQYASFGHGIFRGPKHVDQTFEMILRKSPASPGAWSINGQLFPKITPLQVRAGRSYLIRFKNASMMEHPMHVHGHSFELVSVDGEPTSGVLKDTVVVRPQGRIEMILHANNPFRGSYLLHCHNDEHVEGGMATVLSYAST